MPRPTPAQLLCGTVTVVFSALAMLLLSQTRSGPGVVVIAFVALALGLLVALTATGRRQAPGRSPVRARGGRPAPSPAATTVVAAAPGTAGTQSAAAPSTVPETRVAGPSR